jgi:hypothetical protein
MDKSHETPVCRFMPWIGIGYGLVPALGQLVLRKSNIRNDFDPLPPIPQLRCSNPGHGARLERADRETCHLGSHLEDHARRSLPIHAAGDPENTDDLSASIQRLKPFRPVRLAIFWPSWLEDPQNDGLLLTGKPKRGFLARSWNRSEHFH